MQKLQEDFKYKTSLLTISFSNLPRQFTISLLHLTSASYRSSIYPFFKTAYSKALPYNFFSDYFH